VGKAPQAVPPAPPGHLHFLGIFGHAMRGVAVAAQQLGYTVSGTDDGASPPAAWLDGHGIRWWQAADPAHLEGVTGVIISGHVKADHPELAAALERRLPVRSFAEFVGELTAGKRRIVVTGTHGKTTTTALITWILESAGRHPDYLIGILPKNFTTTVRLGGSTVGAPDSPANSARPAGGGESASTPLAVLEGDEYRASQLDTESKFTYYRPDVAVITSIEMDHPDFFTDLGDIRGRFAQLVGSLPPRGSLYYWQGSSTVEAVAAQAKARAVAYGTGENAAWRAREVAYLPDGLRVTVEHDGAALGELAAPVYGLHNVLNLLAAVAVCAGEGVSFAELQTALQSFKGASRRFERLSRPGATTTVIDDYAHHPSEVATTIEAAQRHFPGRVIAVFQPHTFSRTKELLSDYHHAFGAADVAFVTVIEAAREDSSDPAENVSGADISKQAGPHVSYIADRQALLEEVIKVVQPGDTVLSMSVGGNGRFAAELTRRLDAA